MQRAAMTIIPTRKVQSLEQQVKGFLIQRGHLINSAIGAGMKYKNNMYTPANGIQQNTPHTHPQ